MQARTLSSVLEWAGVQQVVVLTRFSRHFTVTLEGGLTLVPSTAMGQQRFNTLSLSEKFTLESTGSMQVFAKPPRLQGFSKLA